MIGVDVILITYNQQAYVEKAVDSFLLQKVALDIQLRLIVADDCSTDSTLLLIKEKLSNCPYEVEYLPKEHNVGFVKNYQQAFKACQGDYVVVLEGDDYWLQGHIQQHIDFLEAHPDCSMSMNNISWLRASSNTPSNDWYWDGDVRLVSLAEQLGRGNQLGNLSACAFRSSLIRLLPDNFFNLNMADWELGAFMAQYGTIGILKESTSVYRVSENGQWAGLAENEKRKRLVRDVRAMDSFFEHKYHAYCRKYEFKICHPRLQSIKNRLGVLYRKLFQ